MYLSQQIADRHCGLRNTVLTKKSCLQTIGNKSLKNDLFAILPSMIKIYYGDAMEKRNKSG